MGGRSVCEWLQCVWVVVVCVVAVCVGGCGVCGCSVCGWEQCVWYVWVVAGVVEVPQLQHTLVVAGT